MTTIRNTTLVTVIETGNRLGTTVLYRYTYKSVSQLDRFERRSRRNCGEGNQPPKLYRWDATVGYSPKIAENIDGKNRHFLIVKKIFHLFRLIAKIVGIHLLNFVDNLKTFPIGTIHPQFRSLLCHQTAFFAMVFLSGVDVINFIDPKFHESCTVREAHQIDEHHEFQINAE